MTPGSAIADCQLAGWSRIDKAISGRPSTPTPDRSPPDQYNVVKFAPIEAQAMRLVVQLQPGFSGGILEWRILPVK